MDAFVLIVDLGANSEMIRKYVSVGIKFECEKDSVLS